MKLQSQTELGNLSFLKKKYPDLEIEIRYDWKPSTVIFFKKQLTNGKTITCSVLLRRTLIQGGNSKMIEEVLNDAAEAVRRKYSRHLEKAKNPSSRRFGT